MDKKIQLNDVTPGSICKVVADLFDVPCNYSPCEEELHDEDWKMEWCDEHCGKATAADCWMHYFQTRKEVKENE
jgi:hypothetical protein